MSVACGAGSGFGATTPMFAAPANPYAFVEQVEHKGDYRRAGGHADNERDLLTHR